jgi:hypothetical protein
VKFTFDSVVPSALHGIIRHMATAVWRPSSEGDVCNETTRCLDGEIHLPKDMAPSSCIIHFSITVRLCYDLVRQTFFNDVGYSGSTP